MRRRRALVQHDGARRVDDLGLLVHQIGDLVERRDGGEEGVVELRQLLHRIEEVRQVAEERDERPIETSPLNASQPPYPSTTAVAADERKSTTGK